MSSGDAHTARDRIVDTALDLFYKQGYLATGINQVIAESQVAKATFYHHFPSKEALCIAYLQARHTVWMGWLKDGVDSNGTPEERLSGVFAFLKQWMQDSDYRGCAFLNIASEVPLAESEIRDEVIKHKTELRQYLNTLIKDIIESRDSHTGRDAEDTARMVYVLVEGAIVASQNFSAAWPIESAQEAAEALLAE